MICRWADLLSTIAKEYNLDIVKKNVNKEERQFIVIETDFEFLHLDLENSVRCVEEKDYVIRLISDELLEDYECNGEIDKVFFLPSHMEEIFTESLENKHIIPILDEYYKSEMKDSFVIVDDYFKSKETVKNGSRSKVGTSYFSVEFSSELTLDQIKELHLEAGTKLKKLIAHRDDEVAIGQIPKGHGILDINTKIKLDVPKSVHCDFWKLDYRISGKSFQDLANGFVIIS